MSEVKRKKNESFESLLRRFHKKLQQSGRLLQSRKIRFYDKPKNKTQIRREAIRRKEIQAKREYLKKIGKLPEEKTSSSYR